MNYEELLSKDDAHALVDILTEHFGVKRPQLRFTGRHPQRGRYRYSTATIKVAKQVAAWVLVHEFAHHLNRQVNAPQYLSAGLHLNKEQGRGHSRCFYNNLKRITAALGGQYPWAQEYKQLARWAKQEVSRD